MLFSEQAGRLFEFATGERVPDRAEKIVCARAAEGQAAGPVLLVLFLPPRKEHEKTEYKKWSL